MGVLEHRDEATMKRLMLYDYFRGTDSTGFAAVRHATKDTHVVKIASHPLDLFDSKKFDTALSGTASSVFIGHNRAATKGKVNANNAHPFVVDHIIGAHNGTLSILSHMELEDELGEKFDVDSLAIFTHIARFGVHKTIPLLQGAWALVWYDKNENTVNFLRNKERSFWTAVSKNHQQVMWASEWPMIQAAIGLSTSKYDMAQSAEGYTYFATDIDELYTFDLNKLRDKADMDYPLAYAKKGQLKGKEPTPAVTHYSTGTTPFHHHGTTTGHSGSTQNKNSSTTLGSTGSTSTGVQFINLVADKDDPFAGHLSLDRFAELASYGCSWCNADITVDTIGVTVANHDDLILCPECSVDPRQNRLIMPELPILPQAIQSLLNHI
jgi:predicted glutamine amidotransferase